MFSIHSGVFNTRRMKRISIAEHVIIYIYLGLIIQVSFQIIVADQILR